MKTIRHSDFSDLHQDTKVSHLRKRIESIALANAAFDGYPGRQVERLWQWLTAPGGVINYEEMISAIESIQTRPRYVWDEYAIRLVPLYPKGRGFEHGYVIRNLIVRIVTHHFLYIYGDEGIEHVESRMHRALGAELVYELLRADLEHLVQ